MHALNRNQTLAKLLNQKVKSKINRIKSTIQNLDNNNQTFLSSSIDYETNTTQLNQTNQISIQQNSSLINNRIISIRTTTNIPIEFNNQYDDYLDEEVNSNHDINHNNFNFMNNIFESSNNNFNNNNFSFLISENEKNANNSISKSLEDLSLFDLIPNEIDNDVNSNFADSKLNNSSINNLDENFTNNISEEDNDENNNTNESENDDVTTIKEINDKEDIDNNDENSIIKDEISTTKTTTTTLQSQTELITTQSLDQSSSISDKILITDEPITNSTKSIGYPGYI